MMLFEELTLIDQYAVNLALLAFPQKELTPGQ